MFQLTKSESETMVSQIATPSRQQLGGSLPFVFTEHGVLQLANVIRSERATKMSIRIIEIFIKMRGMLLTHKDFLIEIEHIRKKLSTHDEKIELIFEQLDRFIKRKHPIKKIGFKRK